MKRNFTKIASIFFLTVLLAGNAVNLHIFFHDEDSTCSHSGCCDFEHHENEDEKDAPCELCLVSFYFSNLDYNNVPEFAIKRDLIIKQYTCKEVFGYVKLLPNQRYLNHNRNKAPPHLV